MQSKIKLAEWDGLSYYMAEENGAADHTILVEDGLGGAACFNLETGHRFSGTLATEKLVKAGKIIQEFREDFIDYWEEFRSEAFDKRAG
ncbi:hypothetical protein [Candidatus Neptunochlamydia vexilliferae]|uniref:Uncharacterized protein n=1 Tax=Candidatus Neptunichlamydia vexilliferae TaxID=1651774 RepID=A0ABS0AXS6_9BACT|nr:hypothetical protein [Candidatus Neptunochlamydia vexilliferae]MBF5058932.1 hypothetical protein [Candidatus Neptunochlamydia vexilliferae]